MWKAYQFSRISRKTNATISNNSHVTRTSKLLQKQKTPSLGKRSFYQVLKRDDIIASLSDAVVVVETRSKGGAKYTADIAKRKKIPVIISKINNNDTELQDGFDVLEQEGALVAKDEDDIIEIIKSLPKSDNHQIDSFL